SVDLESCKSLFISLRGSRAITAAASVGNAWSDDPLLAGVPPVLAPSALVPPPLVTSSASPLSSVLFTAVMLSSPSCTSVAPQGKEDLRRKAGKLDPTGVTAAAAFAADSLPLFCCCISW
ncbi:hypothetical protein Vretifemale_10586, partial [Volvox reticuliferus]